MTDKASPATAKSRKGGGMKLIIIGVAALLVLGGGGFFAYTMLAHKPEKKASKGKADDEKAKKGHGDEEEAAEEESHGEDGESGEEGGGEGGEIQVEDEPEMGVLGLEPFLVNLADADATRFLRCTIKLVIDSKEHQKVITENEAVLVKIRNDYIDMMSSKFGPDLVKPEGKLQLRKELLDRTKKIVGKPWVVDLLFTDFVVQL